MKAVQAWHQYLAGDTAQAVESSAAASKALDAPAGFQVLHAASLIAAQRPLETMAVLEKVRVPDELVTRWKDAALTRSVQALLRERRPQDAIALAETSTGRLSNASQDWLERALQTGRVAQGDLATDKKLIALFKRTSSPPVDCVLLALGELAQGQAALGWRRIQAVQDSPTMIRVKSHLGMAYAGDLFRAGKLAEVRAVLSADLFRDFPSDNFRFNVVLIRNAGSAATLVPALEMFASKDYPAALFDIAMTTEKVSRRGDGSMNRLSRLLEIAPHSELRSTAEALLHLKQNLY